MEFKYASWIALSVAVSINLFGVFWVTTMAIGLIAFLLGFLTILYLQHSDLDKFLDSGLLENPLDEPKTLGLSIVCDPKPGNLLLISPNIKVQTESTRASSRHPSTAATDGSGAHGGGRRRNFLDAGIELLFKKREPRHSELPSAAKPNAITDHLMHRGHLHFHQRDHHTILDSSPETGQAPVNRQHTPPGPGGGAAPEERSRWRPFDTIKIHTDKRAGGAGGSSVGATEPAEQAGRQRRKDVGNVSVGEEVSVSSTHLSSFKSYINHPQEALLGRETPPGSPRKKKILSGNKPVDKLIHTILDYVVRDFIDSWYTMVSDSREFSECHIRNSIETLVLRICQRIRSADLLPLMTTRLIDDLAKHTRFYRLATQEVANSASKLSVTEQKRTKIHEKLSPQKRNVKMEGHRRNKSETDLTWQLGNAALQKNVANSRFYGTQADEQSLIDPDTMLLNSFFGFSEDYRSECMDEAALNEYLKRIAETVLYFLLPEEDFNCLALRTLLCALLSNSLLKPLFDTLADPDFINLQIAKQFMKDPPAGEFLLKMIRQSTDLSELRACRQLITKEMDAKYKDSNCTAELGSLKYTQKLIDLRISHLQNNKNDFGKSERERVSSNLPQLSLDDILRKELAVSYYLDYLSVLNLQKYVIFYLTAQEWKLTTSQSFSEIQVNKTKLSRDEVLRSIREKANNLYREYLHHKSSNYLNIDPGLIEALNIRLKDHTIQPENTWFDSICKYIYEKQKNEEVFLNNFYQSSAYKQLLRELDFHHAPDMTDLPSLDHLTVHGLLGDGSSDTNSGDIRFDETDDDDDEPVPATVEPERTREERERYDEGQIGTDAKKQKAVGTANLLPTVGNVAKHARSHSDCTGMFAAINDLNIEQLRQSSDCSSNDSGSEATTTYHSARKPVPSPVALQTSTVGERNSVENAEPLHQQHHHQQQHQHQHHFRHKLSARIINTAIHCEGHYAVYAIQVHVIEDNHHKAWHIYRRYSKFLELKKQLVKRFPSLERVPFPGKKAFQNTQRAVLEHRMEVLNRFLSEICARAELSEDMMTIIRNFLEPDTDDRKMHGGTVVKTIESLKSGMSKIRNMPDTLVGGISRMFLGKGPLKERTFYDIQDIPTLELQQTEYPALASALHLLDEVFDLQNKSQWLRRGLINRLLGAPWVSHATNKRIVQTAGSLLAMDKLEAILSSIINNMWPEGDRFNPSATLREDSTRLRTKLAAKISLFALLSDDLKHVVGSVTCNSGLLQFFQMLQNRKLNTRLLLILLNQLLLVIFQTENFTKHAIAASCPTGVATANTDNAPAMSFRFGSSVASSTTVTGTSARKTGKH